MDIKIEPRILKGKIKVPPSKSISHRALICAALAHGQSELYNILDCEDTRATEAALTALGAVISKDGEAVIVDGISTPVGEACIDCHESGSTLRFMIPVAAALGTRTTFTGSANLPNRPITPYLEEFPDHGVSFLSEKMPYVIEGKLKGGAFSVTGDISSQFITGYMLALPLIHEESVIKLTSALQSRPYAELTANVMKTFGVDVSIGENDFRLGEKKSFEPRRYTVEADMSQAAFFLTANALGGDTEPLELNYQSAQGDRAIIDITRGFVESGGKAFCTDAGDIPDLVPILTVLACFADGTSRITNCARLRIKECDRLAAITKELNKIGANIEEGPDFLNVHGVKELRGGDCQTYNDHRIAMSLAIASQRCTSPLIIRGAECVSKSYPHFFDDFSLLGGKYNVI